MKSQVRDKARACYANTNSCLPPQTRESEYCLWLGAGRLHFAGDLRLMLDHGLAAPDSFPKSKAQTRLVCTVHKQSVGYNKNRRPEKSLGASGESKYRGNSGPFVSETKPRLRARHQTHSHDTTNKKRRAAKVGRRSVDKPPL